MVKFKSYCGSCAQTVTMEDYAKLLKGATLTFSCGHENTIASVHTPMSSEARELRTAAATKRASWFVVSANPELKATVGPGVEDGEATMTLRSKAGAWDSYLNGVAEAEARARGEEWDADSLFLYELKAHRFMDFSPNVKQTSTEDFDRVEFEGFQFVAKEEDPGSLGVVVKKTYLRVLSSTPLASVAADAQDSIYNLA